MKILWFSLSPCGSLRRNNIQRFIQGWMISLEDEIKKRYEIDLNVSYITGTQENAFYFEGVHYYPIIRKNSKIGFKRIYDRITFSLEEYDAIMLPQMLEVIDQVNPDLIHIHGTEECFGLILDVVKDIPIVFSIQGLIAPYAGKYYSGYPAEYVRRYEHWTNKFRGINEGRNFINFKKRGVRELHYLKNAKYVIGRTQFDHFIPLLYNSDIKLFQGEEILRPEFYSNQWNKTSFGTPLKIVTTISSGVYKGYETSLHAASLLKRNANFNFEWLIIGYDDNSPWVKIAEKYKGIESCKSNIKLLGMKSAGEMVGILTDADIYVQVSHIENSPNSVCEAMLLGMPIIASFAGGTSSMLKDGEEGILVQDGDPYILAGAIVNLYHNFDIAQEMAERARKRALERHNPTSICNSLVETYRQILSGTLSECE